jgi:hypothetical protein
MESPGVAPIVELRQYTHHPNRRDDLIRLFDEEFIEPQEAVGISVIGQFRDLDDPHKFVWLRGFPTMDARARSLGQFYGGDVWRERRNAANATIIDNDNVLLLRPVRPDVGFPLGVDSRPPVGADDAGRGIVIATIYHIDPTEEKARDFVEFFEQQVAPLLRAAGAPAITSYVPERAPNTFPALPVRDGEHVFVWFAGFANSDAYDHFRATLAATPRWRDSVAVELSSKVREPQTLRLLPTARSRLRG